MDPVTTVTAAVACAAGIVGLGSLGIKIWAHHGRAKKHISLQFMNARESTDEGLRALFEEILRLHPRDIYMFATLATERSVDDATLAKRLSWHLAILRAPHRNFEDWLDFEELLPAKNLWKTLEAKGWKIVYDDTGRTFPGDSMFRIDQDARTILFRTVPYLNSGPVVAAWAVYSAHAAERIYHQHRAELLDWTHRFIVSQFNFESEADKQTGVRRFSPDVHAYLQKAQSWRDLGKTYPSFRAAHPEHFAPHWDSVLADLPDDPSKNARVLETLGIHLFFGHPLSLIAGPLIQANLDSILGEP